MTNFALTTSSTQQAVIQSLNYALSNLTSANVLSVNANGSITYSNGQAYSYLYQYLWVAYATNATGSSGFSFSPTGATYYGVRSSPSTTESTNPADYTWTQVAGGFGTTNFLWYITYGGGQINFYVGPTAPNSQYLRVQNNVAVNLYIVTATTANTAVNGTTASVTPSIIPFPQNSDGSYTPSSATMMATFRSNANVAATANVEATITSAGNVNISILDYDPTISISTIYSNAASTNLTIDFLQSTSGASTSGLVTVLVNGTSGNTGNSGISSSYVTVYTQTPVIPSTPLADTGAWNFGNVAASVPPEDPNWALAQYEYIKPSTITLANSAANIYSLTNTITQTNTSPGFTYYTFYADSYVQGTSPQFYADTYSGLYGLTATAYWGNLTVTGNTAYVDMLLVGAGGDGTNGAEYPSEGAPSQDAGGSGGAVTVISNVALIPGTYTFQIGRGSPTAISSVNSHSSAYSAKQGAPGIANGADNIIAGSGGGLNGASGTPGTYYTPGYNDPTGYYYGGSGIADPWNQITWVGQIAGNGVAYFGGGGSAGTEYHANVAIGGLGGGGNGSAENPPLPSGGTVILPENGIIGTGGAGGGGENRNNPSLGYGYNSYGSPGVLIIRQHDPIFLANGISTWSFNNPGTTLFDEVFSSSALAVTANNNPTANVTNLVWSTPVVTTTIPAPNLNVLYPYGEYVINNQGVYTPTPVGNVVTLVANVQITRGNVIIAAVDQDTHYFIANGGYSISSNTSTAYNANLITFSTPTASTYNVYQNISYGDVGGTVSGFISEALLLTTQGNTGPRGFTPMSYIVANVDPTTANTTILNAMFEAPRSNIVPPIGNGYAPLAQDVAQFFYPNVAALNGGITAVYEYDGSSWDSVVGQVISGDLVATGTITTTQLNANEVWTLQLQSTNANFGNIESPGFWLASQNGDAHFAGNVTIGANLNVSGLVTQGNLQANTVSGNNIQQNTITGNLIATGTIYGNAIMAGTLELTGNIYSAGETVGVPTGSGYWLEYGTGDAYFGGAVTIGNNLVVEGLINGSTLNANTVGSSQIQAYSINYNNLDPSISGAFPQQMGNLVLPSANVILNSHSDYDYPVYEGSVLLGYAKNLAYTEFNPTVAQATINQPFNVYYNFNLTYSSPPPSQTYLVLWQNSGAGGGFGNTHYGYLSKLYAIGSTNYDEITFTQSSYNGPVTLGQTYSIGSEDGEMSAGNTTVIGLSVFSANGAGTISMTGIAFSTTYP